MKRKFVKGQALLIVLLSMAVVLTIVLSVLARSVTDVSTTTLDEDSLRAFSAAEAGVENALIIGSDIGATTIGSATYNASVSNFAEATRQFSNPFPLVSGESTTVWFVSHSIDGNLTCDQGNCFTGSQMEVCWGRSGTSSNSDTTPAIEVSIYYASTPGNYSTIKIARDVIDPNQVRASTENNFGLPSGNTCQIGSDLYQFSKVINFADLGINTWNSVNGLQFAKVRFFYNTDISHMVGVNVDFPGNGFLPSQGLKIESSGSSGNANRKIDVFQSFGETPPIFDSVVFSPSGIVK